MSYIAVASIKGSPGATTTAWALARTAAAKGLRTLLCDCDRFGGSLAPALGLPGLPSVRTLATAVLRAPDPFAVAGYTQQVDTNLAVLAGLTSLEQSVALEPAWPNISNSLAEIGEDMVLVDVGRLPDTRSAAGALCRSAKQLLVIARPDPASAVFMNAWRAALRVANPAISVVLVAAKGSEAAQFSEATGFAVAATLPEMTAQFSKGQARDIPGKGAYQKAIAALLESILAPVEETDMEPQVARDADVMEAAL